MTRSGLTLIELLLSLALTSLVAWAAFSVSSHAARVDEESRAALDWEHAAELVLDSIAEDILAGDFDHRPDAEARLRLTAEGLSIRTRDGAPLIREYLFDRDAMSLRIVALPIEDPRPGLARGGPALECVSRFAADLDDDASLLRITLESASGGCAERSLRIRGRR
ncbi:MAG: prepilin-type N-terminal cleavage/methylation domain-containing protein [Phycisphaeraceae bacterium]|nr:prepilin-type N-terminal cleavage/methylation domain-containing protein [Phycisphaeraceae bacterium]